MMSCVVRRTCRAVGMSTCRQVNDFFVPIRHQTVFARSAATWKNKQLRETTPLSLDYTRPPYLAELE